jgi:hypothetical protein
MASTLGTNALFATSNMKPASGEQADALWAQNLADNTAFLFHREVQLPIDVSNGATYEVRKTPAHNGFKILGQSTDAVAGVAHIRVYPAGTTHVTANEALSGTYSVPAAAYARNTYKLNTSVLTNGSYYDYVYTSNEDVPRAAFLIHGTDATY